MSDGLYRILTGAGVTRWQLGFGAAFIFLWFIVDMVGFYLDHIR